MKKNQIIVDSSVVAKWYLPDEPSEQAFKIKQDFENNLLVLAEPLLIYYEVNNIIRSAAKSFRVNKQEADKAFGAFLGLNFRIHHSRQLLESALSKALDLDISSYDASYIALAEYLEIPFYTADEKLVKKAKSKFVKSLADYS